MLWLEIVAAAMVGVALVVLVVAPLVERAPAPSDTDNEPEDLEETPQGVALTALKEIEFDRATGKLSDDDYASLKQKYTGEALAALRATEGPAARETGAATNVDDIIQARASALRSSMTTDAPSCPRCGPRPESDALFCSSCGQQLSEPATRSS